MAKAADGTDDVRLHGLKGPIISATFSPDRKFVAGVAWGHAPYQGKIPPLMPSLSGSSTQRTMCELKVWDLATAKPVFEHEGNVNWELVEFSADGRRLAATGYEIGTGLNSPELRIWDIVTRKEILSIRGADALATGTAWTGTDLPGVTALVFSPKGDWLAARASKAVTLCSLTSDPPAGKRIDAQAGPRDCLAFLPDGGRMVVGNQNGTVARRSTATGRVEQILSTNSNAGPTLMTLPTATGTMTGSAGIGVQGNEILSVAIDPTGKQLAAGTKDGRGFLWSLELDPPPLRLPGASPQTSTQRASFSEDGALWAAINDIDPSGEEMMEPGRTLFDLSGRPLDLESLLHVSVDVVTERGLRPRVRERVLSEAVPL